MSALVTSTFMPGWPTAATPSAFFYFMLLFGAPAVFSAIVTGVLVGLRGRHAHEQQEAAAGLSGRQAPRADVAGGRPQRALAGESDAEPVVQVSTQQATTGAHVAH